MGHAVQLPTINHQLSTSPHPGRDDAVAIVRRLRENGHVAYFAGGCVRDLLLKVEPKDFDVATDATPDRVRRLFANTQAVGAAFGVVLVRHGRSVVEVATFRADGAYDDGRRPTAVTFTDAAHDARRRDFTINGLFLDPLTDAVIDHVGGRADVAARVVRAIGDPDERFAEDHLRLLRAVRFAARLGFAVEPATAAAIRRHAPALKRISPERVGDELRLMLTAPTRSAAWSLLWQLELVPVLFRFLPPRTAPHRPDRDVLLALASDAAVPFALATAAGALAYLLHDPREDLPEALADDAVAAAVRGARQAMRLSNDESDGMAGVLTAVRPLALGAPPTVATMKRFLAKPVAPGGRLLLGALVSVGAVDHSRAKDVEAALADLARGDVAPPPLITGDDLTAAGLRPGPVFRRVLDRVYDAQLEQRVTTREQALALALDVARA